MLLDGVRGGDTRPGHVRQVRNDISGPGQGIADARFVPPSPQHLPASLEALEKYINTPDTAPILVQLALIHYQCQPLLYLSAYFERNRRMYINHLLDVSQRGEWQAWINFFVEGVRTQAVEAIERAHGLLELWNDYRQRLQTLGAAASVLRLLDTLFAAPMITIASAQQRLEMSTARGASRVVGQLVDADILSEVTGKPRNRVFIARAILNAVEHDIQNGGANST